MNREDYKKMYVWGEDHSQADHIERIVIWHDNKACVAISRDYEDAFLMGKSFFITRWDHCEEISEPKKRLMTREEILGFIAWNPHIVVRIQEKDPLISSRYTYINNIEMYSWAPITEAGEIGEWSKFEVSDE